MATSTIKLTKELKSIFRETAQKLKGSERRIFMAQVVQGLGLGGQTQAERELGSNRGTIRKGMKELTSGIPIKDAFERRGRKPIESKLPNLRVGISLDAKTAVKVGDYDRGEKKSGHYIGSRP